MKPDWARCGSDLPGVLQIVVIADLGGAECDREMWFYLVHLGSVMTRNARIIAASAAESTG
jgi:hypothetical protein